MEDAANDDFVPIEPEDREELTRTPTPVMAPKFIVRIADTHAKRGKQAIFECVVPDSKGARDQQDLYCRITCS